MIKNHYFLVLLSFFSLPVMAQHLVKGAVFDENGVPVAFANVVLLNAEDSTTVYKGAVTSEEGIFLFDDVAENEYLLRISFIGFGDYRGEVEVDGTENLGKLILSEMASNLDEVTITTRRPTITRTIDRIVFNVENSVLSSRNAFDILKRTPGVIVSRGEFLIKNRPAEVYINDRKVYLDKQELQQLLNGFSGENVKSIEVITNPPAKYDAEGGAILNIVMSKNPSIGYKGSVNASNTIAVLPKYSLGLSQYYKNNWLNVFANYNYGSRLDYKHDEGRIVYFEPNGNVDSRWFNDFRKEKYSLSHSFNTILDFTLNDRNRLSLSANILYIPKADSDITGHTEIFDPQQQLDSLFTTDSQLENDQNNILLNLAYTSELGENGATFSAIANYINYNDDQTQDLQTEYFLPNGNLINENSFFTVAGQNTNIYTGQLDLSSSLGSVSVNTGIKYSGIDSESGLDFFDTDTGSRQFNQDLSDEFVYDEDIYAAYLSLSKEWEYWSIKAGLRGEYTDVEGNSISLGVVNTQEYFELFPTFYLLYAPNKTHTFGLDYYRRITRPRFQSLNPYRYFLNENNFNVGNPNLRPGISNKINFNYTYKNKLSFDLYWDRVDNSMADLSFQNNENRTLRTVTANLDFERQFSLDISFYDYITDWWYLYIYSSFFNMRTDFVALESGNKIVTNEVTTAYFQLQNFLTLSKDRTFSGEVTASYLPDFISGSYDYVDPQFALGLGLRKTFFNDRFTASVNVDDIFNTQNVGLSSKYLNQNNFFLAMPESRQLRFSVRYKFGNYNLQDNQRDIEAREKERL